MPGPNDEIVLFHYEQSIFSHRVLWYLHLRGLKYSQCIQPPILPRPDLENLGVAYRRMPLLSIGGDLYCDTRAILDALEQRFPNSPLSPKTDAERGIQRLLENYTIDGGVFRNAITMLPVTNPFLNNPSFLADRSEMLGAPFDPSMLSAAKPHGLAQMRAAFDLMETTFLADGRKWVLGNGDSPSRADIDIIFPLQWITHDRTVMTADVIPDSVIDEKKFPKTFAWMDRFHEVVAQGKSKSPEPTTVDGKGAEQIIKAGLAGPFDTEVAEDLPIDVKVGDLVTVCPTDTGSAHLDRGVLLRLTDQEICILNNKKIRIHFPRWAFRVAPVPSEDEAQEKAPPPKWTMIYHPLSPFSRKAYMFAREVGLDQNIELDQVVVAPVPYPGWSDDNDKVAEKNPLAKIPTLVVDEGGHGIYDSKVIVQYLEEQAKTKPKESTDKQQRWRLRALQALADGILDSQALIIYENKIRGENNVLFQPWIDGQMEKTNRGLDLLETEAGQGTLRRLKEDEVATAADCGVAAALGFLDILGHEWKGKRPKLADWFAVWEKRDSFVKTQPKVDWKSGGTGDIGFGSDALAGAKK